MRAQRPLAYAGHALLCTVMLCYEHVYFAENGRETDRNTDRKKQSTSANYRLTTTHNTQMTKRTEAKPPKKLKE